MIDCAHWTPTSSRVSGACALGRFGGTPSLGSCRLCLSVEGRVVDEPAVEPEYERLATFLPICLSCRVDCRLRTLTPCARAREFRDPETTCPADKWPTL